MFVLIVGGGRVGSYLAKILLEQGYKVNVLENRVEVVERLHRELPTEMIYIGDPLNAEVLRFAGIEGADVLVTTTADDAQNLAIASIAKEAYHVPRVIARVNNPRYAWLYRKELGVDVGVDQSVILASLIQEEMSLGDMVTLLKLRRGEYSLVEEKIHAGAFAIGLAVQDLKLPDNCVIAAIIREGKVISPLGATTLQAGDEILAVVDSEAVYALSAILKASSQ